MDGKLKLLIVDDEKYVRDLLRLSIDWEALGIEVCGEASCGEEGLQQVEELQPNIIFTDICMDYMDGVEFARRVLEHYPYMKIVILSGHNEFDYAARGIDIGVSAYLLKPLDEEKIIETVEKISRELDHRQKKEAEFRQLKAYLEESRGSLIAGNFNAMTEAAADYAAIMRRFAYLGVSFSSSWFQIVSIRLDPAGERGDEELQFFFNIRGQELIRGLTEEQPGIFVFFDLNHNNTILSNDPDYDLARLADHLLHLCREQMECHVTIGIGKPVKVLSQVRSSYLTAREAVSYRSVLGNNQVIPYHIVTVADRESSFELEDAISLLLSMIKNEQLEACFTIVSDCIDNFIYQDTSDIIPVRILISTIVNHIMDLLLQNDLRDTDSFRFCMSVYDRLFRLETIDELSNMTNNLIRSVVETFSAIRSRRSNVLIESVTGYLKEHYSDTSLTLSEVAGCFYVNSSYLSRLFRQQMDTTFTRYLTELRLTRAAYLLDNTDMKSYTIAETVGFHDAKYFSTCFRKHFGMTANEYRGRVRC